MSSPVVVLSPDNIRGSILKKILTHSGFNVLWFKSCHDAEDALGGPVPRVIIFDAKGLYSREADLLKKLRSNLSETSFIVLAEARAIPIFEAQGCPGELCLSEPFDPELVVSKVKEIVSSPPVERASDKNERKETGKDTMMGFMKQFLKLD